MEIFDKKGYIDVFEYFRCDFEPISKKNVYFLENEIFFTVQKKQYKPENSNIFPFFVDFFMPTFK